ncbi:hypothetical protein SESBI_12774 [Sesbania bispinosa]|nr:hypothetical protein SESBI_12774 [Sesbania bispinosa]
MLPRRHAKRPPQAPPRTLLRIVMLPRRFVVPSTAPQCPVTTPPRTLPVPLCPSVLLFYDVA